MTLNQLNYFLCVCEYGNMTKAAAQLKISQPTITDAIKELEKEYQTPLFVRHKTYLSLTPAGKTLYDSARNVIQSVMELQRNMREHIHTKPVINVGMSAIGYAMFRGLFPEYHEKHPEPDINVYTYSDSELEKSLIQGALDTAISAPMEHMALNSQKIGSIRYCLWTYCGNPLCQKKKIDLSKDLAGERMAVFHNGIGYIRGIDESMIGLPSLHIGFKSNQLAEIQMFLINHEGSAIMGENLFQNVPGLQPIPLKQNIQEPVGISWNQNMTPEHVLQFISFAKTYLKKKLSGKNA